MLKVVHDADASNENSAAGGSLLDEIVRDGARAMLAAAITRLTAQWQDDAAAFTKRSLTGTDFVYLWVDGIVRREALCNRVGVKGPRRPVVVANRVKLGTVRPGERREGRQAVLTTPRRAGTARRRGFG